MRVRRGRPYPLGATWDGRGVNVAVFSEVAEGVDLCLFDDVAQPAESARIALPESTGGVWHGYFPDLRPGQLYGLRVRGPYRPREGVRCNPNKLLFDPYAKAIGRDLRHDDRLYGSPVGADDLEFDTQNSATVAPLAKARRDSRMAVAPPRLRFRLPAPAPRMRRMPKRCSTAPMISWLPANPSSTSLAVE